MGTFRWRSAHLCLFLPGLITVLDTSSVFQQSLLYYVAENLHVCVGFCNVCMLLKVSSFCDHVVEHGQGVVICTYNLIIDVNT